jgi:Fic family protein
VVAAACLAFAFVLIYSFEDGNGRLHRVLIHYALARRQFSPSGVIFPVDASILRRKDKDEGVLETLFRPRRIPVGPRAGTARAVPARRAVVEHRLRLEHLT